MGILRADRVSGLGGANAIDGSVLFSASHAGTAWLRYIDAGISDDYNFGTGDFTVECWINRTTLSNDDAIWATPEAESSSGLFFYFNSTGQLRMVENNNTRQATSCNISVDTWYHIALTRASGTLQMWVDGVSKYSASVTGNIGSSTQHFLIGDGNTSYSGNDYMLLAYISNLRIQKGKAEYTAAFTPPTTRLGVTPETVLLCCHDPGNVLAEATGKTLTIVKSGTVGDNSAGIVASRFVPDVGEDHGTTFEDNTKFDTLSYMVPSGGTTTESNRGRGLMMGGGGSPGSQWSGYTNLIDYVEIQSTGIAKDFGDLTSSPLLGSNGGAFSSTRGIQAGGFAPSSSNIIDYVTIATTSNALDFGDLTNMKSGTAALSNQTRGIFAGGDPSGGAYVNSIDYITIATTGDSATFGDLSTQSRYAIGFASPTRGIVAGGAIPAGGINTIEYVTIATTGDATNFGDMTYTGISPMGLSSSTRGIIAGSSTSPNQNYNIINYITIATTGDAADFGDLTLGKGVGASMSNSIRGLFGRGEYNVASRYYTNAIDSITIATLGNAADFGDSLSTTTASGGGADSHGGIS